MKIFTSKKGFEYLSKYFNDVFNITGMDFIFKGETLDIKQTIKRNVESVLFKRYGSLKKILNIVKDFKPDIVLTDFEPLVTIVAKRLKIPFYSINHQHLVSHLILEYPIQWTKEFLTAFTVTDNMYPFAEKYYITNFFFPEVKNKMKKRVFNFGPILRKEVLAQKPKNGKFVLVYATTPEAKKVFSLLKKINMKFIAYGFKNTKNTKNITFKKPSTEGFLKDLANCRAVITNGGYTLISEALYLGKPIYSIPINNQFEQMINAYYLEKLGYGLYDLKSSMQRLMQFLDGLNYFKMNIARDSANFNGNNFIFNELNKILRKI